jgi:mannose-6-phosphate isomerase-like protein (cupin superfamily)
VRPPSNGEKLLAAAVEALAPDTAPPAGLKERLLNRIAREATWKPTPFPGVTRRKLHQDPHTGYVTMLVRMEPGSTIEAHKHSRDEQCYVLEGDVWLDGRAYYSGDFLVSTAGNPVSVTSTVGGNLLLIVGTPDHTSI